jgi:hypothetical protein
VFVPHGREDAQFGERGFAVHDPQDLCVFFGIDTVSRDDLFGDGWVLHPDVPVGCADGGGLGETGQGEKTLLGFHIACDVFNIDRL